MKSEEIFNELIKIIQPSNIKVNESMKKHTTFKIGGNADFFVTVRTIEEIKNILEFVKQNNIELTVLGNGSNILVTDKGIRGIVLKIDLQGIEIQKKEEDVAMQLTETMVAEETEVYSYNYNQVFVTVGAGVKMGNLAQILLKEEIEGFEFAAGIPGTIGGAIRMNAGAYGKEMKDIVLETTYIDMDGNIYTIDARKVSEETLGKYFPNTPMLAAIVKVTGIMSDEAFLEDMKGSFKHKFAKKPEVIEGNMKALKLALKEVAKIQ